LQHRCLFTGQQKATGFGNVNVQIAANKGPVTPMETTKTTEKHALSNLALVLVQLSDLKPMIAMIGTLL
jgi:hypothetical protein